MPTLFVLGLENIRHLHEREAAIRILQALAGTTPKQDAFLAFSVHIGAEVDCLLLTSSGAVIGELKEWPYQVVGRMNGAWLRQRGRDGMEILPGDASPYQQAQKQRSRLSRLLEQETARTRARAPENWSRFINAGLVQCPRLRLEFDAFNSPWWFQAGLDDFARLLQGAMRAQGNIDPSFYATVLRKLGVAHAGPMPNIAEVLAAEAKPPEAREPVVVPTPPAPASVAPPSIQSVHKLVLAGAGAGKTQHMARLIADTLGAEPSARAYAISYTNRARDVLKERVQSLLGDDSAGERIRFGTIHQFAQSLARPVVGAKKVVPPRACIDCLSRLMPSRAVDQSALQQMHRAVCGSDGRTFEWKEPWHAEAWEALQSLLAKRGETTFEGILLDGLLACRDAEALPSHVFVDEFQDTNGLQYAMLRQLAERGVSLTVVGDSEQSIYGFAGALPRSIPSFKQHFEPRIEELGKNYRSSRRIVNLANQLRADGRAQIPARLSEGTVKVIRESSARTVAEAVAAEISMQLSESSESSRTSGDFAILARTQAELSPFEAALKARGVPVQSRAVQEFKETRQVPKLLALLHALDSPDDPEALALALKQVGKSEAARELLAAADQTPRTSVAAIAQRLSPSARDATTELHARLLDISRTGKNLAWQVEAMHREFVVPGLGIFDRAPGRLALLESDAEALARFAEFAAVSPGALARMVEEDQAISLSNTDGVRLATVHESKGDEWPSVYIANIGVSSFPHPSASDFTEEQRLFYVACTRAADELTLCHGDGQPLSTFVAAAVKSV